MALRLLLLAVAAAISFGLLAVYASNATAGTVLKVTVNSTANTDDGTCNGPPNTTTAGTCTLHEAIDAVNDGLADTINFHPTVFSREAKGVIDLGAGEGCLPQIEREVTIDAKQRGVILDGDVDGDDTFANCGGEGALSVEAQANGWDFTLNGGKNFIIRNYDDDAIDLDGDGWSFGDVVITGIITRNIEDASEGIDIDGTSNLSDISITNNDIEAEGDGVQLSTNGSKLTDNTIEVTGNRIEADTDDDDDDGVDIYFSGDLNGKITVDVSDNTELTSLGGTAVQVELDSANAGGSAINYTVNDNTKIHGGGTGIKLISGADGAGATDGATETNIDVSGNGLTDAADGPGMRIISTICCDQSDSVNNVTVTENDDVISSEVGVLVVGSICCGDDNESTIEITDNGRIESEDQNGVTVINQAGDNEDEDVGDSDGNTAIVRVNNNGRIAAGPPGEDDELPTGVLVRQNVGAWSYDGDDNTGLIEVNNNDRITSPGKAVEAKQRVGTMGGPADAEGNSGDDNKASVSVNGNGRIQGNGGAGVFIISGAGACDADPVHEGGDEECDNEEDDGDDNISEVTISENEEIEGNADPSEDEPEQGIRVLVFAGGATSGSQGNRTSVDINENGDITGDQTGILLVHRVCCDSENTTNTTNITDTTGDILGLDGHGIFSIFCCSGASLFTVQDNEGEIRGNGGDGLRVRVTDDHDDGDTNFTEGCPIDCGIWSSVTVLNISGNTFANSEQDGIDICCGQFQDPDPQAPGATGTLKSVIRDNEMSHNRDHGIEIHNSTGINIGPNNTVTANGDDPTMDAGIEIDVHMEDLHFPTFEFNIPGNGNRITQNIIRDNVGLGIELQGDQDDDDHADHENGDEVEDDHGVGCPAFPFDSEPNDCVPFPVIQTQSVADKLVGTACSDCLVEIFVADQSPADNHLGDPLGRQHGEGEEYLVTATADALGNWSITLPCGLGDERLTATATDKTKNTSEFSANFLTLGTRSCATATPTATNTPTITLTPTITNTPPPTSTFTPVPPTATFTPAKACGDINGDGVVNSVDATVLLQFKAGLIDALDNPESADVNGDGEITSVDAALILQLEAGLIDALTGCP